MNKDEIKNELLMMDIDEDTVESIVNKIVNKEVEEDEESIKNNKISGYEIKKNVEIDWKKRAILASKIIQINL